MWAADWKRGWCCKLLSGSRDPSPGNQDITCQRLRVLVLGAVCVRLCMCRCSCFRLHFRTVFCLVFLCSTTKPHTPDSYTELRPEKWQVKLASHALSLVLCPSHLFKLHSVSAGRVSLVRFTAMRLEGLQLDDQGSYECRILLLNEPTDELQNGTWTLLFVTGE